jgi:DNA-binding response OmpR family regulator
MVAPRINTVYPLVAAVGSGGGPSLRLQAALDHVSGEVQYFESYDSLETASTERPPTLVVLELPELTAERLNAEVDRMRRAGIRAPVFVISDGIVPDQKPAILSDIVDFANAAATPPEIVARVGRVLEQLRGVTPMEMPLELLTPLNAPVREAQGVLIDWRTREATYQGVTVRFATAELRMFEALLEKRGGLISTGEMVTIVWGDRSPKSAGLVSVYIWALRGKLARLSRHLAIETKLGSGYRLIVGTGGSQTRNSPDPDKGPSRQSA